MLKAITKQLSQFAIVNREKGAFPSQLETNRKGRTSPSSAPDTFQKVNAIIILRSVKEIDNDVGGNLNEKSNIPPSISFDDFGEFKEDKPTITCLLYTSPSPRDQA